MDKKFEALFTPIQIGSVTVKNRISLAPMECTCVIDGLISGQYKAGVHDFFIERAKDGVGLIIPGMLPVVNALCNDLIANHPESFDKVGELIKEIHQYGAKVFIQLGLFSGRNFVLSRQIAAMLDHPEMKPPMFQNVQENMIACDEGQPNVWMPGYKCRAVTTEEVENFVREYARAAVLCKEAGADGVEVHAVHEGYLMDQFATKYTNHRTDKYGGSFENRYRFAVEVVRAIKKACGEDYPVSMRYSVTSKTIDYNIGAVPGEEFVEAGRDMAESERAIKLLEDAGVDMFNCDNGTYDSWHWAHPPVYMPLNCNLKDVKHIRKFTSKPVYCAGRMQLDTASEEIRVQGIDGVSIGRQFLCDEQFLTKIREGRAEDIRPCISCHAGCHAGAHFKGSGYEPCEDVDNDPRVCALNSHSFAETTYADRKTSAPKKIAVIGGGIGGMEFATRASNAGHAVTLYEKSGELGGAFISAASLSFKEKDRDLLEWYKRQLALSDVDVRLNCEVTDLSGLQADEIVIATGATERKLQVPGSENIITAIDFLRGRKSVGEKVAVIGGGLTGCEIAYQLALDRKSPVIVEMMDDVIKVIGVSAANSDMMRQLIRYHAIPVYYESTLKEVKRGSVVIETKDGVVEIPADSVIASVGYTPHNLFGEGDHIHVIGDAGKVGNLRTVIWGADDLVNRLM